MAHALGEGGLAQPPPAARRAASASSPSYSNKLKPFASIIEACPFALNASIDFWSSPQPSFVTFFLRVSWSLQIICVGEGGGESGEACEGHTAHACHAWKRTA